MGSLLDRAHELARKMGEIGLKNLIWLKKTTKTHVLHNFKGSRRDPLLYLGLIAVILFSIISFTSPVPSFTNTAGLLISEQGPQQGDLFVAPGTKIKESPGLSLIQKNSLVAISPPIMVTPQVLGALIDASDYEWIQRKITEYKYTDTSIDIFCTILQLSCGRFRPSFASRKQSKTLV